MNIEILSRLANPACWLVSAARFSLAMLLLAMTAGAQIAIQDGSPLTITHATGTAINKSFTVTARAKVMVVILEEKGARLSEPATLSWNGQILNRTVQTAYNTGVQRSLAIYYLFNPNTGTSNITGTMTGAATDTWLTSYTLTGVDTTIAPIAGNVNTGTDATGVFSLTFNLTGVAAGAWAAVAAQYANFPDAVTVTGTGGTGPVITDTNYNATGVTAGYVAGLSAGAVTLTTTWVRAAGGQKANFAALAFSPTNGVPPPASPVKAFGIKFLGNTTDAVTATAGAYPISGWNNIANATFTTGTIYSSDGSVSATLTRSGSGADNTWSSGIYPDGGNFSLLYGYQDAGQNTPATNVISGLTGATYDVFLYTGGDNARPSSGTDYLPNYTINGTTYYAATLDGRSAMWKMVQGIPVSQNDNTYPTTLVAGHYIKINNVVPVGGKITISANSDNLTYRSPLNGIELVSVGNVPQVMVQPAPHRLYTGGTAQLQVQAEGANPMAYQWRQNGINLNEGGRIVGSKTNSLTITNLAVTDTSDYDVVITNSYGSVTSLVAHLDAVVMTSADAAFEAWVSAYVVTNGYQVYIVDSLTGRNFAFMWQQAFMIWMVEDTYDRTHSPDQKQLINDLLNTFMKQNGTTLTWDGWDDDLEWGEIALIRGYQITGNVVALNSAIYVWDAVNSRGLDDTFGGGIWEKLPPPTSKCALSVHPQIIAGMYLYQLTGQSKYLTTCAELYAWGRTNIFVATSGQVNEGVAWADTNQTTMKVLTSNNSYNSGLYANAACALYEVTGDTQYLADAILAANQKVNNEPISNENHVNNGYFGAEQLVRAVVRIASEDQNKLWPAYWPWLQANCTAAWSKRRTDLNLTHNDWTTATPSGTNNAQALETQAAVLVQQITPASVPGFVACTNKFSGTVIGTSGSYNNGGSTIAMVFDGSLTTYFDAPVTSGAWVGLDLGTNKMIGQINYWPRIGWASRMLGGVFQGDNTANFSNPVTLYTIFVVPPDNGTVTAIPITNSTAFRYVRYVGPANGSCNVAELQFFSPNPAPAPIFLTNSWTGSQLTLNWSTGRLLEATNVSGPWTTNASATSPFLITPNQPQKFYRVIAP